MNLIEDLQKIALSLSPEYDWRYDDILKNFPQDLKVRVEILNKRLLISESPDMLHQETLANVSQKLKEHTQKQQAGKVIIGLFDVLLDDQNVFIPDIIFVSVARKNILDGKKANGAPDLVVEVWSPGNKKKERKHKKEVCAKNGVTEFWEIYPKQERVIVHTLNTQQEYEVFSEAKKTGKVQSKVLDGLEIELEDIFVME